MCKLLQAVYFLSASPPQVQNKVRAFVHWGAMRLKGISACKTPE